MSVKVLFAASVRGRVGTRELEVEGSTVRQIIEELEARYPGFREDMLEGSRLRRSIAVFVNDADVSGDRALDTPTPEGCEVAFMQVLAGG
jgi:sulfur-carrier protein